jgi:tetratricopeptide (TPR) repeat protein
MKTNNIEALLQVARKLQTNNQYQDSIFYLNEALKINSEHIEALNLLGESYLEIRKFEKARDCFFKIIQLQADNSKGHANLMMCFYNQNDFHQALFHGLRALPGAKHDAPFLYHLGLVSQHLNLYQESIQYYEQSIQLNPNNHAAWNNLGIVHIYEGNLTCAEKVFREGLKKFPDQCNLMLNLARCYDEQGESELSIEYYSKVAALTEQESQQRSNLLFALHYQGNLTPEYLFLAHKSWSSRRVSTDNFQATASKLKSEANLIRIGYLSPDFRIHPVMSFLYPILRYHNKKQFKIFCYSNAINTDQMTERIKKIAHQWRDLSNCNDNEAFELIKNDDIHILVDLAGHSDNNRLKLFAMKPSPIQVSYLGYPGTTGLDTIDYRITDKCSDPPVNKSFYSEKLIYMPNCFLCFSPIAKFPEVNSLPALKNNWITYGTYNRLPKINQVLLEMWVSILKQVTNSRLILKSYAFRDKAVKNRIWSFCEQNHIKMDRIILLELNVTYREHLQSYNNLDIALDTYPYNGTTTTCESLMMGIPVITLQGNAHVSRVSSSILKNIGLTECVAKSRNDYIQTAVKLSQDLNFLSKLRHGLRQMFMVSPLYQWKNFVKDLEKQYQWMSDKKS